MLQTAKAQIGADLGDLLNDPPRKVRSDPVVGGLIRTNREREREPKKENLRNLKETLRNLRVMASNLRAMDSNRGAMASKKIPCSTCCFRTVLGASVLGTHKPLSSQRCR